MISRLYLALTLFALTACKSKQAPTTAGTTLPFPAPQAILVTNSGSDTLSILNRDSESQVVNVSVDIDPANHESPHHVVVRKGQGKAFIAMAFPEDEQPNKKHGNHGRSVLRGRIARLNLSTLAIEQHAEVDASPGDIVQSHSGDRLYVTHFDMARALRAARQGEPPRAMFGTLQVWQGTPLERQGERELCVAPHGMALTHDDSTLLVACYGSDELVLVRTSTLSVERISVGTSPGVLGSPTYGPYSVTLSADEKTAAVATIEAGSVRFLDVERRTFETVVTVPGRAFMPAYVSTTDLIVPLQAPDGFARLSRSGIVKLAGGTDACIRPHAVTKGPNRRVYAVCEGDHVYPGSVVELDETTLTVQRKWAVGIYPDGLAFGE